MPELDFIWKGVMGKQSQGVQVTTAFAIVGHKANSEADWRDGQGFGLLDQNVSILPNTSSTGQRGLYSGSTQSKV